MREAEFTLQCFGFRYFDESDGKANMKLKMKLSDGHFYSYAIISRKVWDKMPQALEENDVIQFQGIVQVSPAQGKFIIVPRDPPKVFKRGIKKILGTPKEYDANTEVPADLEPVTFQTGEQSSEIRKSNAKQYAHDPYESVQKGGNSSPSRNLNRK